MITKAERQVIKAYMQAVCDKVNLSFGTDNGEILLPTGEILTVKEASHKYGQVLNEADDALRQILT